MGSHGSRLLDFEAARLRPPPFWRDEGRLKRGRTRKQDYSPLLECSMELTRSHQPVKDPLRPGLKIMGDQDASDSSRPGPAGSGRLSVCPVGDQPGSGKLVDLRSVVQVGDKARFRGDNGIGRDEAHGGAGRLSVGDWSSTS